MYVNGKKKAIQKEKDLQINETLTLGLDPPISVASYFNMSLYCPECEIEIPDELMLSLFQRGSMSYTLICPNQKCLTSFTAHATFYTFKLGQTSGQEQSSYQITPPITLQQNFAVHETSDKETINASYMNALWYFKLFQLPCFWLDGLTCDTKLNDHILEFCLKQSVKEQKETLTKKMKKIPGLVIPTTSSSQKDPTFKSTNTTDEKNEPKEPSQQRTQTFKERVEDLDPSLKWRFSPFVYSRIYPHFLDFKNYNRNYDVFSNFCQNIVQIEDNLEAEY